MSRKTKRQSAQIFAVTAQLDKLIDEGIEIGFKERPWLLEPHKYPSRAICYLPEERRANEIKRGEVHNELMKLLEDYGWTK